MIDRDWDKNVPLWKPKSNRTAVIPFRDDGPRARHAIDAVYVEIASHDGGDRDPREKERLAVQEARYRDWYTTR